MEKLSKLRIEDDFLLILREIDPPPKDCKFEEYDEDFDDGMSEVLEGYRDVDRVREYMQRGEENYIYLRKKIDYLGIEYYNFLFIDSANIIMD